MRNLFLPLAAAYGLVTHLRNRLFDFGVFSVSTVPVPVVSVGNLTLGGTGKTPMVEWLVKELQKMGKRPLILSRGYGGSFSGLQKVDLKITAADKVFGDEPVLLSQKNPTVPVYVTRQRAKFASQVFVLEKPDVIVLDDGFQHRYLRRNLDIVTLDATRGLEDLRVFPVGRARESLEGLHRAQVIVLTKVNLASRENIESLRKKVPPTAVVVEAAYRLRGLVSIDGNKKSLPHELGSHCLALSAIGNPESFLALLAQEKIQVIDHMNFRDHHLFSSVDLGEVIERAQDKGIQNIVTTEKDAVKLKSWSSNSIQLWVAELELEIEKGGAQLNEALRQIFN